MKIDDFEKKMAIEKEEAKKNEKPKTIFISPKGFYKCVNKGCLKEYDPNNEGECNYHKGGPVFHDCVKFWSCCKTETWDWDDFMKLPTCTVGKHEPKYV
ncbi:MAG: cysteine and histidine-rich domain-containing protein [bacterium]